MNINFFIFFTIQILILNIQQERKQTYQLVQNLNLNNNKKKGLETDF